MSDPTDPIAPPSTTPLPVPPSTEDWSSFDARADAWNNQIYMLFQPEMNALAANVYANAIVARTRSVAAVSAAAAAHQSALDAAASASTAVQASISSVSANTQMQGLYLGIKAAHPTTDNQGAALQDGSWYTNSSNGYWYWRFNSAWKLGVGDFTDAPSKTGVGASGTWGINISGNAASATTANDPNAMPKTGGAFSGGISFGSNLGASVADLSKHINLHGSGYGLSVTTNRLNHVAAAGGSHVFVVGGADVLTLNSSGALTASNNVTAYSDERLKKDWQALPEDFIEQIAGLLSGTYTRIDTGERHAGISAQGLRKILSEVVLEGDDDRKLLSVAYGNAAMVTCVRLCQVVLQLGARIQALESK